MNGKFFFWSVKTSVTILCKTVVSLLSNVLCRFTFRKTNFHLISKGKNTNSADHIIMRVSKQVWTDKKRIYQSCKLECEECTFRIETILNHRPELILELNRQRLPELNRFLFIIKSRVLNDKCTDSKDRLFLTCANTLLRTEIFCV